MMRSHEPVRRPFVVSVGYGCPTQPRQQLGMTRYREDPGHVVWIAIVPPPQLAGRRRDPSSMYQAQAFFVSDTPDSQEARVGRDDMHVHATAHIARERPCTNLFQMGTTEVVRKDTDERAGTDAPGQVGPGSRCTPALALLASRASKGGKPLP